MTRILAPIVVLALGLAAILLPQPGAPEPEPAPGTVVPPLAVCPTEEGGTRNSRLGIVSTVAGEGRLTILSGGGTAGTGEFSTGASGSASIDLGDVAAVGKAAGLVEFPDSESAAAAMTRSSGLSSAEVCARIPDQQVIVGGGSTIEDRIFQIQLMNPYSAEASADITAFSESGRESSEALRSILVPARSTVLLDLSSILPGRESLDLLVETTRGNLVTYASSEVDGDQAVWRAVAPGEIWYVPMPTFSGSREVVISSVAPGEVAYQVDVFGPEGLEEAALEGTIDPGAQAAIDLSEISPAALAVRVVATEPVGVFARLRIATGFAMTPAVPAANGEWLLPGAGSSFAGGSRLVLANVGVDAADVVVTEVRGESRSRVISLQPNQVLEVTLDEISSDGVSLSADGDIVPLWLSGADGAVAVTTGFALVSDG